VTTCLACNLKKVPCQIGSLEDAQPKWKVRKPVATKAKSASPEHVVQNSAREVRGCHDLYSHIAPGYSQQVLDELLVTSKNMSDLRGTAEAAQKDQ